MPSLRPARPGELDAIRAIVEHATQAQGDSSRPASVYERFSGPVPPPAVLEGYEATLPGCADRLVTMAEREQAFRHDVTKQGLKHASDGQRRGQQYAFAVVCVMAVAIVACAWLDQPEVAQLLGGATLSAIVLAFLGQRALQALETRREGDEEGSGDKA